MKTILRLSLLLALSHNLSPGLVAQLNLPYEITNTIRPHDVNFADMDNDGLKDFISHSEEGIGWSRNIGDAAFSTTQLLIAWEGVDEYQGYVNAVDIDNDGDMDLLVVRSFGYDEAAQSDVWIIENLGLLVFTQPQLVVSNVSHNRILVGDFNADDYPDFVVDQLDNLCVYLNNTQNGFALFSEVNLGDTSYHNLELTDLDQDQWPDVLVVKEDEMWWYEVADGGSLSTGDLLFQDNIRPTQNSVLDFDNDGDNDICYLWWTGDVNDYTIYPRVKLNDGLEFNQTIEPELPFELTDIGDLVYGDYDNDGNLDAFAATSPVYESSPAHLHLITLNGTNNFELLTSSNLIGVDYNFRSLTLFNVDDDSDLELFMGDVNTNKWQLFDTENSQLIQLSQLDDSMSQGHWDEVSDIDLDGDLDVVSLCWRNHGLVWYENLGDLFSPMQIIDPLLGDVMVSGPLYLMDFDFDGDDDIFISQVNADESRFYENLDGTLQPAVTGVSVYLGSSQQWADIDGNGYMDCIYPDYQTGFIVCRYGTSNETLGLAEVVLIDEVVYSFMVDDIDGDSDQDMVYTISDGWLGMTLFQLVNNGLPVSEWELSSNTLTSGSYMHDFGMMDWNNDGWKDVLCSNFPEENTTVYFLNSTGVSSSETFGYVFASYMNPIFDFDQDGLLDFMTFNYEYGFTIRLNNGNGTYSPVGTWHIPYNPESCEEMIHDFDNDGKLEYLLAIEDELFIYDLEINYFPNAIEGGVFYDENGNGLMDMTESWLPAFPVEIISNNQSAVFGGLGNFFLTGDVGDFHIEPQYNSSIWQLTTDSSSYDFEVINAGEVPSYDLLFGFTPLNDSPAGTVGTWISGWSCLWDEFLSTTTIANNGNTLLSGVVSMQFDDQAVLPIAYYDEPDSVVGSTIYWHVIDLLPTEQKSFITSFDFPELDFLGETIPFSTHFQRNTELGEEPLFLDNLLEPVVTCSYDPNDKSVSPQGFGSNGYITDVTELEYTIRFQNTGNDTAFNVVVTDVLNTHLVRESFQLLSSSHEVSVHIDEDDRVSFYFNNIMLPDSGTNYFGSMGMMVYRIQLEDELVDGTEITNQAHIYFDNNPPITTNTVLNTIYSCDFFPGAVTLEQFENTLVATAGASTYTWYLEGDEISDATSFEFVPLFSGNYLVVAEFEFGCSYESNPLYFDYDSVEEATQLPVIWIYPNPTHAILNITGLQTNTNFTVEIFDISGRVVRTIELTNNRETTLDVNVAGLPLGFYYLGISNDSYSIAKSFIRN